MRSLQEIIQTLNVSIIEEAKTNLSFWDNQTYGDFFSDNLSTIDTSKTNFPILSLLHADSKEAQNRIYTVIDEYNQMNFLAKIWWRITHMDESINDYEHLYTLLRLVQLKNIYTNLKNTLTLFPETPIYSLYPTLLNAFTLYFNSYLPSHGFFNRLFQENNKTLHNQFNQQSNWLNHLKSIHVQDNQQPIQETNSCTDIELHLGTSINETAGKNNKKQVIPDMTNPDLSFPKIPKEDTEEAWTLWLTQIMDKPHSLEAALNTMRDHTKQLTKNPQTDLLRYTILSLLSVRWVEAIKWQKENENWNSNYFSVSTEEAANDAKKNIDMLWKKVLVRHYHPDKNSGVDASAVEDFTKITQAFNDKKELNSNLIDKVISSNECPSWIAGNDRDHNDEKANALNKIKEMCRENAAQAAALERKINEIRNTLIENQKQITSKQNKTRDEMISLSKQDQIKMDHRIEEITQKVAEMTNTVMQRMTYNMPKDTPEAWTLWLMQVMDTPQTIEASIITMRYHTEQLSLNPQTTLLRYTILSVLSARWIEAIKWQNRSSSHFSMTTEKASSEAKTNLQMLWEKIVSRHYQTINRDKKELAFDLINEAISSNECPTWIAAKNKDNRLSEIRQQNQAIKEMYRNTVKTLDEQAPQKQQKSIPEGSYTNNMRI